MFKNILIPTDGSKASQKAAAEGVALAKALGARVTAFFAAPPPTPIVYRDYLPVGYTTPAEHEEMIERMAATYLGQVERLAKKAGVPCESIHITSDYPDESILKIARKKKCDLIVMASKGEGGLRRALIGSVAQKVLNQAEVPVMIYR
jgi:nucleotide-binding universal stress UspA family protein